MKSPASRPLHSSMGSPLCIDDGAASARLANGVFGDPLLEIRPRGVRPRLLFDLGDAGGLSRRELHGVRHVFITHAHFDHICGFVDLLRTRLSGTLPPCRIYGPPGIAHHVSGFVAGFHWDRIDEGCPEFQVGEVYDHHVRWHRIQPGAAPAPMAQQPLADGLLLEERRFSVRCARLDHGIPVLSYALEVPGRHHVRPERLRGLDLTPGPWLGALTERLAAGDTRSMLTLPDGREARVADLARDLIYESPGSRWVYATDFADTGRNRAILADHARDADWLFCEATFRRADRRLAVATQHLTTEACGEIASRAGVKQLVPFHFSKRYIHSLAAVYEEIQQACAGIPITRAAGR